MIVFAHGYDVTPDTYAPLLDAWTRAGFVVVAPFFPDEKASAVAAQHGANTEGDLANEPADLVFVTSQVLAASARRRPGCPILHGLIRPTQVALAGHSDGGDAVAMLAYDHGKDPQGVPFAQLQQSIHYGALIVMAGAVVPAQKYASEAGHPSLLLIQSATDTCNPIRQGAQLYRDIRQPNKWFLELTSAHHLPPFDGVDQSAFTAVAAVSTRFLESSLHVTTPTPSLMTYANRDPSVARMFDNQTGPVLSGVPTLAEECGTT
jgi:pimeloyl-ACP methyl ester carboxylesterase